MDEFRAQRQAVDEIHARLGEVRELLRAIKDEVKGSVKDEALVKLLSQEQSWLRQAQGFVQEVKWARERETRAFWPSVWRRWSIAVAFALVAVVTAGAGYVWAMRPYVQELTELRSRVEVLDHVAQRVLQMTPGERRQFDALMDSRGPAKH